MFLICSKIGPAAARVESLSGSGRCGLLQRAMIEPLIYTPPRTPLQVIHRDAALLVLDKPPGLLSVPGKAAEHRDCLELRVRAEFPEALLVHRLDMDTSGVMVFARTKAAQRHLGLQFERRKAAKTYLAVVDGVPQADSGTVDLPLIADWPNRPLQMVDHDRGKPARTDWRVLARGERTTHMELRPLTGRSHQLRVHMQAIGHPILGDRFYGTEAVIAAANRLQLHARTLELHHPDGGARVRFEAPAPF